MIGDMPLRNPGLDAGANRLMVPTAICQAYGAVEGGPEVARSWLGGSSELAWGWLGRSTQDIATT
jgi:hypothetical protein